MNANAANFDPNNNAGGFYPPNGNNPERLHATGGAGTDAYYGANLQPPPPYMPPAAGGGEAYYDNSGYHYSPPVQEYHHHDPSYGEWNHPEMIEQLTNPEMAVPAGSYYPVAPLAPELYGASVSAVAYNDVSASIHVASHTQSMGHSGERRSNNRASLLVTHSTTNGMLYSSCAGHPEADPAVLKSLLRSIYNYDSATSLAARCQRKPPHAYRPPYCGGGGGDGPEALAPYASSSSLLSLCQMGIKTLLPFDGYLASVSPSAVRVHSQGGLVISDQDISGMMCGTPQPSDGSSTMTHLTVGGTPWGAYKNQHVHCMDLYQGLRIVSSHGFKNDKDDALVVTSLATNHAKQALVAGCTDGTIRLFDGSWRKRGGMDLAKVNSHNGGVTSVSVSDDGHLICTAGYSSRPFTNTSIPYAFPDHFVMIYDARYLGRGGVVHAFTGMQGGPRFVSFLPGMNSDESSQSRALVCSGQSGGGLQILTPFETGNDAPELFLAPSLGPGESITTMAVSGKDLALGTSQSKVLQFRMSGYEHTTHSFGNMGNEFVPSGASGVGGQMQGGGAMGAPSTREQKEPLVAPSYTPEAPPLSIDPRVLLRDTGPNMSVFSSYVFQAEPTLTPLGSPNGKRHSSFGEISEKPLLTAPKRTISARVMNGAKKVDNDYLATVPAEELYLNLLENVTEKPAKSRALLNPNKMLYSSKIAAICYEMDMDPRKKSKWGERQKGGWNDGAASMERTVDEDGRMTIPSRYALTIRPTHLGASYFDHAQHNDTGLWPGWEYPHTMPNSYAPPVLLLLYFVPEIRAAILEAQNDSRLYSQKSSSKAPTLSPELGFLFYQIDSLSSHALTHPEDSSSPHQTMRAKVGSFVPYNFLAAFTAMPEAAALALLDGAPAAVETARRPEAFYRFLLHHLDSDLSGSNPDKPKLIDSLYGLGFTSVNEFITGSGPPSVSSTRALTVGLAYEPFMNSKENKTSFGEVLRYSLCKESRLRAWCEATRSYETVVQRKIASSLPKLLALSCSCSGKRGVEDGLSVWRSRLTRYGHFLPELIEVELEEDGNVLVRELQEEDDDPGKKSWRSFKGNPSLPAAVSEVLKKDGQQSTKVEYRLDAVLSFVHDDSDPSDKEEQYDGHHVLHCRVPRNYKKRALGTQICEANRVAEVARSLSSNEEQRDKDLTQTCDTSAEVFEKRSEITRERLGNLGESGEDDWVIVNGYVVSDTVVEDARAFHVPFKEPCLVVYRAMDRTVAEVENEASEGHGEAIARSQQIPIDVMSTRSISSGQLPRYSVQTSEDLPGEGDLIAFDAEFVSVQEEKSVLTATGSKVTVREARSTLARMSVIDCRNGRVIIDDYVLPHEPVADYLTRFSGVTAGDLDPKLSPHHLISMRSAYLKLRLLLQRGCIFVGHGLRQDFLMVNLFVPPRQIIDTVDIFHKDKMRYISLRFLANHLLGHDMQQDTHDSIEDAGTAFQLYHKALSLKKEGSFQKVLNSIYEVGQKTDWKLGVDEP